MSRSSIPTTTPTRSKCPRIAVLSLDWCVSGKRATPRSRGTPPAPSAASTAPSAWPASPACWPEVLPCPAQYTVHHRPGRRVVSSACGHIFCSGCLPRALRPTGRCPTCRARCRCWWPGGVALSPGWALGATTPSTCPAPCWSRGEGRTSRTCNVME